MMRLRYKSTYLHRTDLQSAKHLIGGGVGNMQIARDEGIGVCIVFVLLDPPVNRIGAW
jgi:hypothetical protein